MWIYEVFFLIGVIPSIGFIFAVLLMPFVSSMEKRTGIDTDSLYGGTFIAGMLTGVVIDTVYLGLKVF